MTLFLVHITNYFVDTSKRFFSGVERLEVDPSLKKEIDFGNIVSQAEANPKVPLLGNNQFNRKATQERPNSENFQDDPDVPPLE